MRESWHRAEDEEAWLQIMEEVIAKAPNNNSYQASEWEPVIQEILASNKCEAQPAVVKKMTWYKWAAAILIGICLVGGLYFTLNPTKTEPVISQVDVHDALPGFEGAVLTLEDGTEWVLDSAKNGQLAINSSSNITVQNGTLVYDTSKNAKVQYHTISTNAGREYRLMLSDGSVVKLNAESSIRFPTTFSGSERRVSITGEVYFEVAHNEQKPFFVTAAQTEIKVLGTTFNINSYKDEKYVKTVLAEGSVEVISPNQTRLLKPGELANVSADGKIDIKEADLNKELGWVRNRFVFENSSIENIMRQVSRWYDVEVVYERKPTQSFIAEIPRNVKASEFFRILEATGWVSFSIDGKKVTVK